MCIRERTRSASESSSWPIRLLFFLHRATLPSMKSKNRPNGMNAKAIHMGPYASGGPRQNRIELRMDMKPQKPVRPQKRCRGKSESHRPFISVIRSARWRALGKKAVSDSAGLWGAYYIVGEKRSNKLDHREVACIRGQEPLLFLFTWITFQHEKLDMPHIQTYCPVTGLLRTAFLDRHWRLWSVET